MSRRTLLVVLVGLVSTVVAPMAASVQPSTTILASDAEARSRFGEAIAVDGDTMLVGDPFADAPGARQAGAVYVYEREGDSWVETQKIQASNGFGFDHFGFAVDLSGDWAIVGAPHADSRNAAGDMLSPEEGRVYFFERSSVGHFEERVIYAYPFPNPDGEYPPERDRFGWSVAIHEDSALAGAPWAGPLSHGDVSLFSLDPETNNWSVHVAGPGLPLERHSSARQFGSSVAVTEDRMLVGAPVGANCCPKHDAGLVYVYTHFGASFPMLDVTLGAFDGQGQRSPWFVENGSKFGQSIAIEGDVVAVGAPGHRVGRGDLGAVYFFEDDEERGWAFIILSLHVPGTRVFGFDVDLDGSQLVVGAEGAAFVFPMFGAFPGDPEPLEPATPNPGFGASVALGPGGPLVGSPQHVEPGIGGVGAVFEFSSEGSPPPTVPPPAGPGEISGRVWFDDNGNGLEDVGEPGIEDAGVQLLDGSGQLLSHIFPDSNGEYAFTDLEPGDYQIHIITDFAFTTQDVGSDDSIDSDFDPATGNSPLLTLDEGEVLSDVDAGLVVGS